MRAVAITALFFLLAFGLFMGVRQYKRDVIPGKQAAAYLDALIQLGQMPSGAQVDAAVKAKFAAPAQPVTPEQLGGEYVDKVPAEKPKDKK